MMLEFNSTMDPHSKDVVRPGGKRIGSIQWHPGRSPRFVAWAGSHYTLTELKLITAALEQESMKGRTG
jgi:hypothetical protein